MIDVVFLLLIYFILTMTFRQAEGQIPGTLPAPAEKPVTTIKTQVQIYLEPSGKNNESVIYGLNGLPFRPRDPDELFAALERRQRQLGSRKVPVIIRVKNDVRWEFVVEAFNQALRARFKNIGFAGED